MMRRQLGKSIEKSIESGHTHILTGDVGGIIVDIVVVDFSDVVGEGFMVVVLRPYKDSSAF